MKRLAMLAAVLLIAPPGHAQMKDMEMKDMDMKAEKKAAKATVHKASGVVKKVDTKNGKVTIAHGPVQSIGWPAMSMTFTMKDKKLLDSVAVDKKVDFEFVQQGKDYVVTSVK